MTEKEDPMAAHYRKQAAACIEIANQMSSRIEREHMIEMAQRWLELAQRAEKQRRN
jgi:hypothetical protein